MVTIASARIDENGNVHGGKGGDQTGKEVCTQEFYQHKKGWNCLRFKDAEKGNALSGFMIAICNNEHIGYNQYKRNELFEKIKNGELPQDINENCNTDCSATIRSLLWLGGIHVHDFTTADEKETLLATGQFDLITNVNENMLRTGDILVTKTKGHTVMIIDTNGNTAVGSQNAESGIEIGKTYTVTASALNVRKSANISAEKVTRAELTANARAHSTGSGALKQGTRVTVQGIKNGFVKIPSGWISARYLK